MTNQLKNRKSKASRYRVPLTMSALVFGLGVSLTSFAKEANQEALAKAESEKSSGKEFSIDSSHSNVGFTARHMVSEVDGQFTDFEGKIFFNEKSPENSKVTAKVKVKSVNTFQQKRDEHLRSEDFFNEKKYPTLNFISTEIRPDGDKRYKMTGNLTMHGVTKPVVFDVEYLGGVNDPKMGNRVGFTGAATVNRKDFGINWNKVLDSGGLVVGDDVKIRLKVEGIAEEPKG